MKDFFIWLGLTIIYALIIELLLLPPYDWLKFAISFVISGYHMAVAMHWIKE
jgi:hypothetical protein